ncbi:hypothetical protein EG68_05708 [Paragonimus skrjabini miyazakii]|uniref:Enhancer of mRNA-decapping protein 4 WD40 repeat region domain-containing protein n=1 Tax=Paragonimus skrjabini miyazakii TaxID=59628 RepID=A0A8S9YR35_9TREM|nr:hypothetical protein EG68_05708 [Paragonimus skrjabini miyazakii]
MEFAAHHDPLLAVLDKSRTLHVFKIEDSDAEDDSLKVETLLVLRPPDVQPGTDNQTLCWCPWVPNSSRALPLLNSVPQTIALPPDPSMLLSISCGSKVEILDVASASKLLRFHFPQPLATELNAVESEAQATNEHVIGWNRNQLVSVLADRLRTCVSYACTEDHGNTVTALQISRDASCMASACLDGKVRVFSLFNEKDSISDILIPVHVFSPHGGLPLYGMVFLDERDSDISRSTTWSSLLTGAQYNRELRLWSCANWSCIQTLRFCMSKPDPQHPELQDSTAPSLIPNAKPSIIMSFDWSKSLLVAADITRRGAPSALDHEPALGRNRRWSTNSTRILLPLKEKRKVDRLAHSVADNRVIMRFARRYSSSRRRASDRVTRRSVNLGRHSNRRTIRASSTSTCNHSATMMGDVELVGLNTTTRQPEGVSAAPPNQSTHNTSNNASRQRARSVRRSGPVTRSSSRRTAVNRRSSCPVRRASISSRKRTRSMSGGRSRTLTKRRRTNNSQIVQSSQGAERTTPSHGAQVIENSSRTDEQPKQEISPTESNAVQEVSSENQCCSALLNPESNYLSSGYTLSNKRPNRTAGSHCDSQNSNALNSAPLHCSWTNYAASEEEAHCTYLSQPSEQSIPAYDLEEDSQDSDEQDESSLLCDSALPEPHEHLAGGTSVLYILELTSRETLPHITELGDTMDRNTIQFTSISEFLLTTPCILFALGACRRTTLTKSESRCSNGPVDLINLEIHSIHTWHLLNGTITFELPRWPETIATDRPDAFLDKASNPSISISSKPALQAPASVGSLEVSVTESSELTHVTYHADSSSITPFQSQERNFGELVNESEIVETQTKSSTNESEAEQDLLDENRLDEDLPLLRPSDFSPSDTRVLVEDANQLEFPEQSNLEAGFELVPSTFQTPTRSTENAHSAGTMEPGSVEFKVSHSPTTMQSHLPVESIEDAMRLFPISNECTDRYAQLDTLYDELSPAIPAEGRTASDLDAPASSSLTEPTVLLDLRAFNVTQPGQSSEEKGSTVMQPATHRMVCVILHVCCFFNFVLEDQHLIRSGALSVSSSSARLSGSNVLENLPNADVNWSTMSLYSSSSSSASCPTTARSSHEGNRTPGASDVQFSLTSFEPKKAVCERHSESLDAVMAMLRLLMDESHRNSRQMESVMSQLNETRSQLRFLSESHSALTKRLVDASTDSRCVVRNRPTPQTDVGDPSMDAKHESDPSATSKTSGIVLNGAAASTDSNRIPEWGTQILLQLRTQQGEFARRFAPLETVVKKLSTNANELSQLHKRSQAQHSGSSSLDTRLEQLPKLTCELVRPLVRAELQNAFVNNVSRIVDPLQKVMLRAIQDCLNSLPTSLSENVSRMFRDKVSA